MNVSSLPVNIPLAPKCKYVVRHTKSNRIFMAGSEEDKAALYFSEPNDPSVVKQTSVMYPATDDGPITGLATFVDAVVVLFKRSLWVWRGIDPEIDAIWQKIPVPTGTNSPQTITQITQLLTYAGGSGIYGISPAAIGQSADIRLGNNYVADLTANKVTQIIKSITNQENIVSAYDPNGHKYMLAYCDDDTGVNNKILVLDETLGSYAIWEGIQANDIYCTVDGEILIASDNYILKLDDGYSDVDIATGEPKPIKFEAEIRSSFNAPMVKKLFTKCWTQIDGEEETTNFNLKIDVDDKLAYDKEMEITNTGEQVAVKVNRFRATGKQLSVTITNDEQDKGFRLYGFGVEVTPVKSYSRRV